MSTPSPARQRNNDVRRQGVYPPNGGSAQQTSHRAVSPARRQTRPEAADVELPSTDAPQGEHIHRTESSTAQDRKGYVLAPPPFPRESSTCEDAIRGNAALAIQAAAVSSTAEKRRSSIHELSRAEQPLNHNDDASDFMTSRVPHSFRCEMAQVGISADDVCAPEFWQAEFEPELRAMMHLDIDRGSRVCAPSSVLAKFHGSEDVRLRMIRIDWVIEVKDRDTAADPSTAWKQWKSLAYGQTPIREAKRRDDSIASFTLSMPSSSSAAKNQYGKRTY